MRSRILLIFLFGIVSLALLYLVLVISFKSPSPVEIYHYVADDGWVLDSASVVRRVHRFHTDFSKQQYGTGADSIWDFFVSIYGRNLVHRSLKIDSIEVVNLVSGIAYRVLFSEYRDPRSGKLINPAIIAGPQTFEFTEYIDSWQWYMRGQITQFQSQYDSAFQKRALAVRVRSSRGFHSVLPTHYITTGSILEWTEDIKVTHH